MKIEREELGDAWMAFDDLEMDDGRSPLNPLPEEFPEDVRPLLLDIAYEHEKRLKDRHWWEKTLHFRPDKRFHIRTTQAIGEGIALGIKLGLMIAQQRQGRSKELARQEGRWPMSSQWGDV